MVFLLAITPNPILRLPVVHQIATVIHGHLGHTLENASAHLLRKVDLVGLRDLPLNLIRCAILGEGKQDASVGLPLGLVSNHHGYVERYALHL